MINSIIVQCVSMVFLLLLFFVYFSKDTIDNVENRIYKRSIIINLFSIMLDIMSVFTIYFVNGSFFNILISKLYLITILMWISFLTIYIFMISIKPDDNVDEDRKSKKNIFVQAVSIIIFVACCFYVMIANIDFVNEPGKIYSFGQAVSFIYTVTAVSFFVWFIRIFTRFKYIVKTKCIPIVFYVIFGILSSLIQQNHPEILLISFAETFCTFIMFFTIENPDLKMLKEIAISRDRAEQANRAKSDFLSSMSHEIRTPLNAIVGLSEDITNYKDQVPKEVVEDSEDIMNASQTLLEIVGNILDINKIESNKMEIIDACYNFKEEITNMCKVTSTRIGDKHIDFNLNIAEDIPYELYGDKGKVKEVVNNLLTNSIKYTESGRIDLTIKCVNNIDSNLCNLIISCQDTGRGIKAENITKLFTKFERLDVERNTTAEGTGLGLAITKSLVEMMGGKINVQSQFGEGSLFVVQLPQKISQLHAPVSLTNVIQSQYISSDNYKGKRILIVDDNKLNIKVARKTLQDFDFIIDEASDGQQCLDKVKNGNEYDLILMDIMMPNMSGETAFLKLKENPNFKIPTIALTADAVSGAKEKYLDTGFVDYLAKPFTKQQIKEKLDFIFVKDRKTYEDRWKNVPGYVIGGDVNNITLEEII